MGWGLGKVGWGLGKEGWGSRKADNCELHLCHCYFVYNNIHYNAEFPKDLAILNRVLVIPTHYCTATDFFSISITRQ